MIFNNIFPRNFTKERGNNSLLIDNINILLYLNSSIEVFRIYCMTRNGLIRSITKYLINI